MYMIAVGIDVSKGKRTVAVLSEDGSIRVKPYEVLHTADQLRNLAKMFRTSPENAVIVLEPTGHYHYPILKVFRDASLPVCLVNPYLMKKYGDAQLRKAKTDKQDSLRLARYALEKSASLVPYNAMDQNDISEQETVDIGPFQYSYADEDVKPADKTKLKAYLDKLAKEGVDTAKYTTSTVEKYEEALEAAETVMDDDTLTAEDQQKIADTLAALKAAVEGLKEKADTSALKAYMDELKADEELADLTKYTEDTVAAYQAALADAENTAENQNLSVDEQSVVDNVLAALKTARTNLTLKDDGSETPSDVNKEELKDYVDDLAGQKLDLSKYSSDTVAAYQAALKHAQDILGSADASQADVDQALADLKAAYDSMIKTADKGSGDSADKDNTDKGSADKNGGAVQTGDSTPVILWAVILIAAAGAVTGVVVVRRRKSGK